MIESGTLRRAYNDSLSENILCRNTLLISLAYMEKSEKMEFTDAQKQKLIKILVENGYSIDDIQKNILLLTNSFFPSEAQINRILEVASGNYKYEDGYIRDVYFKKIYQNKQNLEEHILKRKPPKTLDAKALKRYIYENKKIEHVLENLGCGNIKYHSNRNCFTATNPDGDNSEAVEIENTAFLGAKNRTRNFSHKSNPDIYDLILYYKKCTLPEVKLFLHKILGLTNADISMIRSQENSFVPADEPEGIKEKPQLNFISENTLKNPDYYPAMHKNFYLEGITEETRKKFGLMLSCSKYRSQQGTVIPLRYYENGELLGINLRRSLSDEELEAFGLSKYNVTKGYQKNLNIYGLWENRESIQKAGYVVVYEAEKSVLKRDSLCDSTGVAIQGHFLYEEQAQILADLNVDIIISMDKDVSLDNVLSICKKIDFKCKKNVYYMFDKWELLGEKESVADKSCDIFNLFMKNKMLYDKEKQDVL